MDKVNLAEKFAKFREQWQPKIVGELNGQLVKLARFQGEFVWHHHEHEDEIGDAPTTLPVESRAAWRRASPGRRSRGPGAVVRAGDHGQHRQRGRRTDGHRPRAVVSARPPGPARRAPSGVVSFLVLNDSG